MKKKTRKKIYKYLDQVHIYGGLYCAAYLVFMGLTGLLFSHNSLIPTKFSSTTWQQAVSPAPGISHDSLITEVSRELDLFGHRPFWLQWADSTGGFHFQIMNPAANYDINLTAARDTAFVKESRKSIVNVMVGLHSSSTGEPPSWITRIWHLYAESAAIAAIVVLLISIYFWFRKSIKSKGEWLMVSGAALFSISYILFIWLIG
ncbi:MAG TPA: hypothetical protein VE870_16810 [Bacteroidales bacterium]|nr:hypothetical protein [Bacteroidales bacterium]